MDLSDKFARGQTMFFRFFADAFFARRYGHRAVVLETVAGAEGPPEQPSWLKKGPQLPMDAPSVATWGHLGDISNALSSFSRSQGPFF